MSNMYYNRFQNTYKDLKDCHDNLFSEDLYESEEKYRKLLVKLCEEIVDEYVSNIEEFEKEMDEKHKYLGKNDMSKEIVD